MQVMIYTSQQITSEMDLYLGIYVGVHELKTHRKTK